MRSKRTRASGMELAFGCDWASVGARLRACRVHAYKAPADIKYGPQEMKSMKCVGAETERGAPRVPTKFLNDACTGAGRADTSAIECPWPHLNGMTERVSE